MSTLVWKVSQILYSYGFISASPHTSKKGESEGNSISIEREACHYNSFVNVYLFCDGFSSVSQVYANISEKQSKMISTEIKHESNEERWLYKEREWCLWCSFCYVIHSFHGYVKCQMSSFLGFLAEDLETFMQGDFSKGRFSSSPQNLSDERHLTKVPPTERWFWHLNLS